MVESNVSLKHIERKISYLIHDLEPSIASFQGFLNLVKSGRFNHEDSLHRKLLDSCETALTFSKELLRTMLETASLQESNIKKKSESASLVDILEKSLALPRILAWEKDIAIKQRVHADETNTCIDRYLLERIIMNLSLNAIKHSPQDSGVSILLTREKGDLIITVDDQGPGINEAELTHIFDEYLQLDLRERRIYQGVGLGLAFCREASQHLGGTIEARNKENVGFSIKVSIPESI